MPKKRKRKKKKSNTPRRKRMNQQGRLMSSKEWIKNYEGKRIVKGYAKWYGVDRLCAIRELRMNGVDISTDYEAAVKRSEAEKIKRRHLKKEERERAKKLQKEWEPFSDETYAYIAGYTSNGFAYGITHEEMEAYDALRESEEMEAYNALREREEMEIYDLLRKEKEQMEAYNALRESEEEE